MGNRTDKLQNRIDTLADNIYVNIKRIAPSNKILLLHYISGTKENPYGLRRSKIKISDSILNKEFGNKYEKYVDKTFRSFIRFFGNSRQSTLLHFVLEQFSEYNIDRKHLEGFRFTLKIDKTDKRPNPILFPYLDIKYEDFEKSNSSEALSNYVKNKEIDNDLLTCFSNKSIQILPQSIEEMLFPNIKNIDKYDWLYDFIKFLIKWDDVEDWNNKEFKKWIKFFDIILENATNRSKILSDNSTDAEGQVESISKYVQDHQNKKSFLSVLHAGLFYFFKFFTKGIISQEIAEFFVIPIPENYLLEDVLTKDSCHLLVLILNHEGDLKSDELLIKLDQELESLHEDLKDIYKGPENDSFTEHIYEKHLELLHNNIKPPSGKRLSEDYSQEINLGKWMAFSDNLDSQLQWVMTLSRLLMQRTHEGKKLEFYFILADLSEIRDNRNFDLVLFEDKIDASELAMPEIRSKSYNLERRINTTVDLLAKEHFPWFENGKYALFWDISSKEREPKGLINLRGQGWKNFIKNFTKGNSDPNLECDLLLISVLSSIELANVVRIRKEKAKQSGDSIVELLRYIPQIKKWTISSKEKRIHLLENTLNNLNGSDSFEKDDIKSIIDISNTVALNPEKGGLIILASEDIDLDHFHSLGKPWNIRPRSNDELIALISHDGASVKYPKNINKWTYRKILNIRQNIPIGINKLLSNLTELNYSYRSKKNSDFCPFSLVGTRRWNSAHLAFHKKINTVISISQDGDLTFWSVNKKNEFTKEIIQLLNAFVVYKIDEIDLNNRISKKSFESMIKKLKGELIRNEKAKNLINMIDSMNIHDNRLIKENINKMKQYYDNVIGPLLNNINIITLTIDGRVLGWNMHKQEYFNMEDFGSIIPNINFLSKDQISDIIGKCITK
jgi:hypothetical protein